MKKYYEGGDAGLEKYENPYQRTKAKKPLPSEIKTEGKSPVDKYIREPFRKANDQASKFFESKGLTNPVDVIDEELGGETVAEARARRQGMPVSKSSKYKSGGSVKSSASKRADGCAQRGKTRGKMV
jgi:hypothetical protein